MDSITNDNAASTDAAADPSKEESSESFVTLLRSSYVLALGDLGDFADH